MIRIFVWCLLSSIIYWSVISNDHLISKMGLVLACLLVSIYVLITFKGLCFVESVRFKRNRVFVNHFAAPLVAIVSSIVLWVGLEAISFKIVCYALLTSSVFLPNGNLEAFWRIRWRGIRNQPDSGDVDDETYKMLYWGAWAWVIMPIPMYWFVKMFYSSL